MTKKILIFSTNYFPYIGGAEVAIKEITDRIDGSQAEFDMVVPRYSRVNAKEEQIGNVNVYRVGYGYFLDKWLIPFTGYRKARELELARHYDAIWVMMASQASIAGARFKKRFPHIRLVLTLQEGDEESHLKRYVFGSDVLYKLLIRPWYERIFHLADHITVISEYLKERAERHAKDVPVSVIPNGVEMERFAVERDMSLRASLDIADTDKVIITTSRLVKKNAVGDLVEAMAHLDEHVKLVVVGDGSERRALESKVESLKLKGRVVFVGSVSQEEIPKYLSIADVFCRPSLSEGQGISFLEAMAAGVPVVATPVGGIPDFLKDGVTGVFCSIKDPKSIAGSVNQILGDPSLSSKLRENAFELVKTEYKWEDLSDRLVNVLKG